MVQLDIKEISAQAANSRPIEYERGDQYTIGSWKPTKANWNHDVGWRSSKDGRGVEVPKHLSKQMALHHMVISFSRKQVAPVAKPNSIPRQFFRRVTVLCNLLRRSMASGYKFQGWLGLDKAAAQGNMIWQEYTPKPFEETDIDIKITHCGICGSDLHTLRSAGNWGEALYPVCVGHEIVGTAVRVGSKAEGGIKIGDRVGVGAQSLSCLSADCEECSNDHENYCQNGQTITYNSRYPDGSKSYGGYADYWRGPSHFVFKIPDALPSDVAAPMLCGVRSPNRVLQRYAANYFTQGVTAFSPLIQYGAGPGKRVGIVGVGGLGHFGVMGAKALGVDRLVAISRTSSKRSDAIKMGADDFIATDEDENWAKKHRNSLDIIVCTVSSPKMPLAQYLQLLRVGGTFVQIGAPEDNIPSFNAFTLLSKKVSITGSGIGSPKEIREMLDLFAKNGVHTWNNNVPMRDANKAIVDMDAGKARYRIVLVNEKHTSHI